MNRENANIKKLSNTNKENLNNHETKWMQIVITVCYVLAMWAVGCLLGQAVSEHRAEVKKCVVIDPGHGGFDPGKVSANGIMEKDVNLQIALWVKAFLEQNDVQVVMTRVGDVAAGAATQNDTTDIANHTNSVTLNKSQDMEERVRIINETMPDLTVSIHANSYSGPSIHGAQVFYYGASADSQRLAGILQETISQKADVGNRREISANDSYYLLKKAKGTIAIVECGFLTNPKELALLCDGEYQKRMAYSIAMGIMKALSL